MEESTCQTKDYAEQNKQRKVVEELAEQSKMDDMHLYDFESETHKLQNLTEEIEELFSNVCKEMKVSTDHYNQCRDTILGPIRDVLRNMIKDARPPYIYFLGRSRSGKSSLVNAMLNSQKAKTDPVTPTTSCATSYDTNLGGRTAWWKIVDSSGFFPTTQPTGDSEMEKDTNQFPDCFQRIKEDLQTHKPDIILYIVSCNDVGNLGKDLQFVKEILDSVENLPPIIVVLSKADIYADPRTWPPEKYASKQKLMSEKLLHYMARTVLGANKVEPIKEKSPFYGYQLYGCAPFLYAIPIATLECTEDMPEMRWNIDRLMDIIGSKLPCQSWLYFYRALEEMKNLKGVSTRIIYKLSYTAMNIPNISLPGECTTLFLLQMIMIAIIAKLAGHDVSVRSVYNYLAVCDILKAVPASLVTACVTLMNSRARTLAISLGAGVGIGRNLLGVTNSASTFCVGKSAQLYYFKGKVKQPEEYAMKWKPPQ